MFDVQIQVGKKKSSSLHFVTSAAACQPARQRHSIYYSDPPTQMVRSPAVLEEMKRDLVLNTEGSSLSPQIQLHHRLTLDDVYTPPSLPGRRGGNTCSHSKLNLHKYVSQGFSSLIQMRPKSSVEKSRHSTVSSPDARMSIGILRFCV